MQHLTSRLGATRFGATLILGALLGASSARAQDDGAPDMGDFGNAVAQAVEDAPEDKKAPIPKGGIASGLTVPRVKPGQGARAMFETMREKAKEQSAENPEMLQSIEGMNAIEKQTPQIIAAIEAEMLKKGFAPRDMGTAYALAFLTLRESATGRTTTDAQDLAVVRTVSRVMPEVMGAKWKTFTPAHKEKLYETTIMGAAINNLIVEELAKKGDAARLALHRKDAADAFEQLIGVPPAQIEISPEGQISGTVPVAPEDAATETETEIPAAGMETEIPAEDAAQ